MKSTVDSEPYFTVLMPVFNEERNIATAVAALEAEFDEAQCSYEILIVDDGSVDGTVAAVREAQQHNAHIRLCRHRHNMGPGSGLYTGFAVARGTFVIFVPADLAMSRGELRKYIDASRHADVVNGLRSDRRDYNVLRKIMSHINIYTIRLLFGMKLRQFNYIQAYRREMFERFYPRSRGVFITAEVLVLARDMGYRIVEVEVEYLPRLIGTTGVANWRSIRRTLEELGTFWAGWMWARMVGKRPFDAKAYKREHVLPLLVED